MRVVSRLAWFAAFAVAPAAWAECRDISPAMLASDAVGLDLSAAELANTYDAYKRIAEAAGFQPPLRMCSARVPNAQALDSNGKQVIAITTGLIHLMQGSKDEIAAVIAHEFGHLKHKHALRRYENFQESVGVAVRQAQGMLRRGATLDGAVGSAKVSVMTNVTAFSRTAEREADDEGFALTQSAGFDPEASRRAFQKLRAIVGGAQNGWFATHPGIDERMEYSGRLAMNESYRQRTLQELRSGNAAAARETAARWRREMPDSGAAAYYDSVLAYGGNVATEALEEAVGNFEGDGLSQAGQSHQEERGVATLALCISLYRESHSLEALTCVGRLDGEQVEAFKKATGWENLILTKRRAEPQSGSLFAARTPTTLAITNCPDIARRDGLKAVKPWKGIRAPGTPEAQPEGMACSRNMCDCQSIDLEKTYPTLFGPGAR
jgi:Zn-dependent protease with chaperone function